MNAPALRCSRCGRFVSHPGGSGFGGGKTWCEPCAVALDYERGPGVSAARLEELEPRLGVLLERRRGSGSDHEAEARRELEQLVGFRREDVGPRVLFTSEAFDVVHRELIAAMGA